VALANLIYIATKYFFLFNFLHSAGNPLPLPLPALPAPPCLPHFRVTPRTL
jgi:hypothetical protein